MRSLGQRGSTLFWSSLADSVRRISQEHTLLFYHSNKLCVFCFLTIMHKLSRGAIMRAVLSTCVCVKNYIGT